MQKVSKWDSRATAFSHAFTQWRRDLRAPSVNVFRSGLRQDELRRKARRYRGFLQRVRRGWRRPLDTRLHWDLLYAQVCGRIESCALYYLFTGDRAALKPALAVLPLLEKRPERCFTHSACLAYGMEVDQSTAAVIHALATMRACFGELLDPPTDRRLVALAVPRCLEPGLDTLRQRKAWWTTCRMNWRSHLTGSLGLGAMVFADVFPAYQELIRHGIEGALVVFGEGDREGGWNEGPSYAEFGIFCGLEFGLFLKRFTSGKVNLLAHPYARKTSDFHFAMMPAPGRFWNWADCSKGAAASLRVTLLAREYRNRAWQDIALQGGATSFWQLYFLDPDLTPAAPTGYPLTKVYPDLQAAVCRTGFGAGDNYVGLKGGSPNISHNHMDTGSLVIYSGRYELLAELDPWPYAEGRGKRGGFFDRRGPRWNYDGCDGIGHNLVTISDSYPRNNPQGVARLKLLAREAERDIFTVDSTPFYRPRARLVRRYFVFLRPDVVLLIDHVEAPRPVRARAMFHYLDRARRGEDHFEISTGPARLLGRFLHPTAREDNIIVGLDDRLTTYLPTHGRAQLSNRYVYVENLQRARRIVLVTALQFGRAPLRPAAFRLRGNPDLSRPFKIEVLRRRSLTTVAVDLARKKIGCVRRKES